jgi:hypothetical protein
MIGALRVRQNRVVPTPVAGAKLSVANSIQPDRSAIKPAAMEARGIRLQGERGISRQPIAQGMPECSGCTCMLVCVLFALFAHETAGAASTRHSLLPLVGGTMFMQTSGARCRENAKLHPAVIASAAKQSTAPQKGKNGLLRCARNDGDRPRTGYPPSRARRSVLPRRSRPTTPAASQKSGRSRGGPSARSPGSCGDRRC